jgi:hypothetical protein
MAAIEARVPDASLVTGAAPAAGAAAPGVNPRKPGWPEKNCDASNR